MAVVFGSSPFSIVSTVRVQLALQRRNKIVCREFI